jgi:type VI secretion system protein ImpE
MKQQDFGEVLLPILYPFSWQHERDDVKLGRETDWMMIGDVLYESTFGQKLLVLDGERTVPFLEIRCLQFDDSIQSGAS